MTTDVRAREQNNQRDRYERVERIERIKEGYMIIESDSRKGTRITAVDISLTDLISAVPESVIQ